MHPHSASGNILFSIRGWKKAIFDSFLPVGFPHSVSDDYLAYQTYDSLQAFFSTISSLLANRALLQGLGVGDASSSATFAMLLTILKDAMSRIATIVFANRFGLRIEPDAKRYRFLADLFNDTAFFLELCSPYLGPWGKVVALSAGEGLRALCGVAAGASKAALSVHFAKHDNLAELNAKEASQETAVGLVGLLVGTAVLRWVEDDRAVLYLMIVLVFSHLGMNYLGVRSVCMATLNRQRATILFREYLATGKVLSPRNVAAQERIILWDPIMQNRHGQDVSRIEFTSSYLEALRRGRTGQPSAVIDGNLHTNFISSPVPGALTDISMILFEEATPADAISAWFGAMEISWLMDKETGYVESIGDIFRRAESKKTECTGGIGHDRFSLYRPSYGRPVLWEAMSRLGWDPNTQLLETGAPLRLRVQPVHSKEA